MSTDILQFAAQYSLYSGFVILISGVIGNILNILTFTQMKLFRDNRCAFYLTVESISNFLYQIFYISSIFLTSIYPDTTAGRSVVWCRLRYTLSGIFVLITFYTVCLAAIDQFFSTNYWFGLRQMCTLKLARCLTIVSICLWIAHSIVFGSFFDIHPSFGCVMSNPILLQYSTYFYYPLLGGLLPIVTATCFGFLAYRNVRRIVRRQIPIVRRRLDRQMTAMVLIRVILFVCLSSPYTIYRVYIVNFPISQSNLIQYGIGRLVQAIFLTCISLNYTVSFYAFAISSSRFRHQVKFVLVKKCWRRLKTWCCSRHNRIAPDNIPMGDIQMEVEEDF